MKAICVALLSPLVLAACAAGGEHAASRVDSAGIEIVTSPAEDLPAPWTLVPIGRFGGGSSDTLLVAEPDELRLAAGAGRFFVLDPEAPRVITLDSSGQLLSMFGKVGDGPGEIRDPLAIALSGKDSVTLLDMARWRLLTFSPEGDTLGDAAIPGESMGTFGLGYLGGALVMERHVRESTRMTRDLVIVGRGDSGVLARYRSPEVRTMEVAKCGVVMRLPPLLEPRLEWSSAGDWLAVVSSAEYDVGVFHVGSAPRRVRRAIAPREGAEELARRELGEGWELNTGERTCLVPPDEVIEGRGVADRVPTIERLLIDADGWLRVLRYSVGDEAEKVDVFNPAGEYIGTITGEDAMPAAAAGDYIATAMEDSLGLASIVVSRIEGRR